MAVTQYIGARYVPDFASPIEWNNTRTYDPLTIVTHQGNSYTSRQYVPKGVDITNEAFWVLSANYNAQVEAYRKEVSDYKEVTDAGIADIDAKYVALSERVDRKAVYIGNSFTKGIGSTGDDRGLFALTKGMFSEAWKYIGSGTGFLKYADHGVTFKDQLEEAGTALASKKDEITDVIFISAAGDSRAVNEGKTYLNLAAAAQSAAKRAKVLFPNCRVWVFQADFQTAYANTGSIPYTWNDMKKVYRGFKALSDSFHYIGWGGWNLMHSLSTNYMGDSVHPNDAGYEYLAEMLSFGLDGSDVVYKEYTKYATVKVNESNVQARIFVSVDGCSVDFSNSDSVDPSSGMKITGLLSSPSSTVYIVGELLNQRGVVMLDNGTDDARRCGFTCDYDDGYAVNVVLSNPPSTGSYTVVIPRLEFV